ncbi:hypothetical protein EJB05_42059, partial [Eragrostis curvula]
MDVEVERAAAGWVAMDSILSQLSADTTDDSSICMAIYDLGNAAASPGARMGHFLPNTAHFVEVDALQSQWFPCIARYEKVCELGSGHHGVVVKARNSVTGKIVALKTLHPKPLYHESDEEEEDDDEEENEEEEEEADPEVSRRVLREACFMAACRGHPSLVSISAIGRLPRTAQYCLIMEHVGPSLYDVLVDQRGGKPFPERDVRRMMRQVMSGAKAMHDRGVVHRAIHPLNILVADGGAVFKIGDFGEATSMAETDVPYEARLSYVAPECLLCGTGCLNSEVSDSWSMGCLMLELLMGEDHFAVAEADDDDDYEGVLYKVFDVLGVPGKRTMQAIRPQDDDLARKVQQWRARQRRVGKQRRSRLDDLVPCDALSEYGFEVLEGLLMINPKKRLTATAALQLPWFTENTDDYSPAPQGD